MLITPATASEPTHGPKTETGVDTHEPRLSMSPNASLSMLSSDSDRGFQAAYDSLFLAWGIAGGSPRLPCVVNSQTVLRCLRGYGDLGELERLNRPAVIELWDDSTNPFFAALLSVSDNAYSIEIDGKAHVVSVSTIRQHWFGNYTVLWRTPPGFDRAMQLGHAGTQVEWLRERLESLTPLKAILSDRAIFDSELEDALKTFQRSQQLRPDGIAGPHSLIRLHSSSDVPIAKLRQDL